MDVKKEPLIRFLTSCQSTQSLEHFDEHNSIVLTEFQYQGKGRRGHIWRAPFAHNFTGSTRFHTHELRLESPQLLIGVSSAICDVIRKLVPHKEVGIKWPNDVWVNGRKIAGTLAEQDGDYWIINGEKQWNTGIHKAKYNLVMARTSGKDGQADGITAFFVPMDAPGVKVEEYMWTFNMPTDHGRVSFTNVRVHKKDIFNGEGKGLAVMQLFFNENRIRQAASSLGAAQFCVTEAIKRAQERKPFGKKLSTNQAIQFPLAELQTRIEMLRALIHKTAWQMDTYGAFSVSLQVSMCNYQANRLCCEAADQAMQTFGGMGCTFYI